MPFKSEAQRKFLFANKPNVAREFANATPEGTNLPERVREKKRKSRREAIERSLNKGD